MAAENEDDALAALNKRGLLKAADCWRALGNMPNNQSVVHAQQSSPTAALVEKFTNGLDAILLRRCKARGIDPRGPNAPQNMGKAVQTFFGDLASKSQQAIRALAEENLVLYATGSRSRPCLSFYDAGEGQLPEDFPSTFCSLIYGSDDGSYKGAVPFVQGRFNMGGTGVLPFCGDDRRLQLIVSRVPSDVVKTPHEWGFTIFCFFPSRQNPAWRYLVGPDGEVLTAGSEPLGLAPKVGAKSGEICAPRERIVPSGTLIKMYNYKAPRSNICGELFKKFEEYLLRPAMPIRLVECRPEYKANVMGVTVWDRLSVWGRDKLEEGFEDGASIQIKLSTGEVIPAEVRVFKAVKGKTAEEDLPQTGLRALINGQSHARRDAQFFRTKSVDKEHIAGSMLVTLDCSELGQESRNLLFMSNREIFRDDPLLIELLKKLQSELRDHEGLKALNQKRYEDKIANATSDNDGINALEELLSNDPSLADLFGSMIPGQVAARTADNTSGTKVVGEPQPFKGTEFPSYFKRASGATAVQFALPRGSETRVSFLTDVKNNYFTRNKYRGKCSFSGGIEPTFHLFNGRLTFTFHADKKLVEGSTLITHVEIADAAGHGPFKLAMKVNVVAPREATTHEPPQHDPKVNSAPSRPEIFEVMGQPTEPPIVIERVPGTNRLQADRQQGISFSDRREADASSGGTSGCRVRLQVRLSPNCDGSSRCGQEDACLGERRGCLSEEYPRRCRGCWPRHRSAVPHIAKEASESRLTRFKLLAADGWRFSGCPHFSYGEGRLPRCPACGRVDPSTTFYLEPNATTYRLALLGATARILRAALPPPLLRDTSAVARLASENETIWTTSVRSSEMADTEDIVARMLSK